MCLSTVVCEIFNTLLCIVRKLEVGGTLEVVSQEEDNYYVIPTLVFFFFKHLLFIECFLCVRQHAKHFI